MARGNAFEPDPDTLRLLAGFSEAFAAQGRYDHAISNARSVLQQYELLARAAPGEFADRVEEARARVERLVDRATELGAPTEIAPSPEVVAMVEAVNRARTSGDPRRSAAQAQALRLDELPDVPNRRLRKAHPSIGEAVRRARQVHTGTPAGIAEKLARHAVILRPLGVLDVAHEAALAAAQLYDTIPDEDLGPLHDGYRASALLILADGWCYANEIDGAYPAAQLAVSLFERHRALLVPANMFDLVKALTILAQCQRERDETDDARQSIVDAKAVADAMHRQAPGDPGSIVPTPWGLPVVPTEDERRSLYG